MTSGNEPRRGRPPIGDSAKRASFNTRIREAVLARVKSAAEQSGRSVSEEIEFLLENYTRDADQTQQTLALLLGEDDGALLLLIAQVLRVVKARGEYLDNPAAYEKVARAIGHLFKRLSAPEDGHVRRDNSLESEVDKLLYELGAEPYQPWGAPTYLERWAQEQRARLGRFGGLLVKMQNVVRNHLQGMPPAEPPPASPEAEEMWTKAFNNADERHAAEAREHEAEERTK